MVFFIPYSPFHKTPKMNSKLDLESGNPQDCLQWLFPYWIFVLGHLGEQQTRSRNIPEKSFFYAHQFALTFDSLIPPRSLWKHFILYQEK